MAWYAYCITEHEALQNGARSRRPFPLTNLTGIHGAPVLGYTSGDFAVVVSEFKRQVALDQKAALDHARVVSECFRMATILPFRFATVFESDDALRRAVRTNRRAFLASLERLRGKSEMHLKIILRDGTVKEAVAELELPAAVGAAYLSRLREKAIRDRECQTKARAVSVQVHRLFNPLDEEVTCKKVESGRLLIDIAHLIDTKSLEIYQNRYNNATRQLKDCQLVISGPWPPYHFMPGKLRTVPGAN